MPRPREVEHLAQEFDPKFKVSMIFRSTVPLGLVQYKNIFIPIESIQ